MNFAQPNLTGVPSAVQDLAPNGTPTPEEMAQKKKKLLAAGNTDVMAQFGNAAMALLGSRGQSGMP